MKFGLFFVTCLSLGSRLAFGAPLLYRSEICPGNSAPCASLQLDRSGQHSLSVPVLIEGIAGTFSGFTLATLAFGSLGVESNLIAMNYRPVVGTSGGVTFPLVVGDASQDDVLTLFGYLPATYNLIVGLSLDGNFTSTHPRFQSEMGVGISACGLIPTGPCFGSSSVEFSNRAGEDSTVPSGLSLTVNGISGASFRFGTGLWVGSLIQTLSPEESRRDPSFTLTGSTSAKFGSTLRILSLLITDTNGSPVGNLSLTSESGFAYPLDPANTSNVPEPRSSALITFGVLGLIVKRGIVLLRERTSASKE